MRIFFISIFVFVFNYIFSQVQTGAEHFEQYVDSLKGKKDRNGC